MTAPRSHRSLARARLDARLAPLRPALAEATPPVGGWLRAIRQALGMPSATFAARLGIAPSSAVRLEASEQRGTIQLDSLRRAAAALDCDVAYVLIPRTPLEDAVAQRKRALARETTARVQHHMALEDQLDRDPVLTRWREDNAVLGVREQDLWPPYNVKPSKP